MFTLEFDAFANSYPIILLILTMLQDRCLSVSYVCTTNFLKTLRVYTVATCFTPESTVGWVQVLLSGLWSSDLGWTYSGICSELAGFLGLGCPGSLRMRLLGFGYHGLAFPVGSLWFTLEEEHSSRRSNLRRLPGSYTLKRLFVLHSVCESMACSRRHGNRCHFFMEEVATMNCKRVWPSKRGTEEVISENDLWRC